MTKMYDGCFEKSIYSLTYLLHYWYKCLDILVNYNHVNINVVLFILVNYNHVIVVLFNVHVLFEWLYLLGFIYLYIHVYFIPSVSWGDW